MKRDPLVIEGYTLPRGLDQLEICSKVQITLEQGCDQCDGSGDDPQNFFNKNKCSVCNGRGLILTDSGRSILELVADYLKSKDCDSLIAKKI